MCPGSGPLSCPPPSLQIFKLRGVNRDEDLSLGWEVRLANSQESSGAQIL